MTRSELFDPLGGPHGGWPPGAEPERAYLQAFCAAGAPPLIANLRTRVMGARYGERILPLTINEAEYGDAYVCLPHTAYALYAKAELKIEAVGPAAWPLGLLADGLGALMKGARLNRVVHLDNWMLSTNLHGGWRGQGVSDLRALLVDAFPGRLLAVRSINSWSDPALSQALVADGWRLLPSRQIYVTDDLGRDWAPRRDTRRDLRLLARSSLAVDELATLGPGDAQRIADLYGMLYLGRYSRLNPAFTPAYVEMTHRHRIFDYRGLRDRDGRLAAVVGCFTRDGLLTTPIVGYDTTRPASEGLYRMASVLLAQMALERGARLNGSAGAAGFKRNRGARPVVEYTAYFTRHLSPPRRAVVGGMETLLNRAVVPFMAARGL